MGKYASFIPPRGSENTLRRMVHLALFRLRVSFCAPAVLVLVVFGAFQACPITKGSRRAPPDPGPHSHLMTSIIISVISHLHVFFFSSIRYSESPSSRRSVSSPSAHIPSGASAGKKCGSLTEKEKEKESKERSSWEGNLKLT